VQLSLNFKNPKNGHSVSALALQNGDSSYE